MMYELFWLRLSGVIVALFMIGLASAYYKRNAYSYQSLGIWILAWLCFIFLLIFPHVITIGAKALNISRRLDLLYFGAIFFLTLMVFYTFVTVKQMERSIVKLVSNMAQNKPKRRLPKQ